MVFGGRFEAKLLFAEVIQPEVKTRRVLVDLATLNSSQLPSHRVMWWWEVDLGLFLSFSIRYIRSSSLMERRFTLAFSVRRLTIPRNGPRRTAVVLFRENF